MLKMKSKLLKGLAARICEIYMIANNTPIWNSSNPMRVRLSHEGTEFSVASGRNFKITPSNSFACLAGKNPFHFKM